MASAIKSLEVLSANETQATYYKDATELASLIRTKQLSSREVVKAHLDRIEAIELTIQTRQVMARTVFFYRGCPIILRQWRAICCSSSAGTLLILSAVMLRNSRPFVTAERT